MSWNTKNNPYETYYGVSCRRLSGVYLNGAMSSCSEERVLVDKQQRVEPGTKPSVMGDHARSFAWLMLMTGIFLATLAVIQDILVHFFLGNPAKVQQQASMLAILLTLDFLIATLGLFLVAGASQSVVAAIASLLARRYGRRTQALALLAVPAVAVLTWYCFDYLTPSNMALIPGLDYVPYEHGLTPPRYGKITARRSPRDGRGAAVLSRLPAWSGRRARACSADGSTRQRLGDTGGHASRGRWRLDLA